MRKLGSAAFIGATILGVMLAATAPAFAAPGNNGTVKVDGEVFDDLPNNEPHVGCVFQIDFYGYDEGQLFASASFELDPPTGAMIPLLSRTGIFIGEDPAAGGGSTAGLDAYETFDLGAAIAATGEPPHPQQGWHIGLTVHADGSQGADVKHKEFWVSDCGGYPPPPPTTSSLQDQQLAADLGSRAPSPPSLNLGTLAVMALFIVGASVLVRRRMRASIER
jgi:hypothetical protein